MNSPLTLLQTILKSSNSYKINEREINTHEDLLDGLRAAVCKKDNGYLPPYWELIKMAKASINN